MPKVRLVQNNFSSGELSPYLHGRPDFARYSAAFARSENLITLPHGGLIRRSGTKYVTPKNTPGANPTLFRLIPFIFSEADVFVLEFGDQYVRFFRKDGQVIGAPYTLASPYTGPQLAELSFAQSGNVMYLFHPDVQTRRLIRVTDTNWSFTTVDFYDGPYHKVQVYDDLTTPETWTLQPSVVGTPGAAITITIRTTPGGAAITPLNANDVGRYIRIYHAVGSPAVVTWGVARITSLNGGSPQINATVEVPFGAATESGDWRISIFHAPDRWPAKGTFHEERLVWARNKDYPNSFGGSVTDDFTNFAPSATDGSVADDNAYFYTLGTGQIDEINWVSSGKALLLGTNAGPYSVTGNDIRTPIGPKAIQATKESSYGASSVRPVYINRAHIYVSQTKKQIHEMYYSLDIEGFATPVLSIVSEHLFRSGAREMYPAEDPYHMVWGYCANGSLYSLTYMKDQNVVAFNRHMIGGSGKVRALTVIPTGTEDQVWLIVERVINGNTVYFVEYIDELFVPDPDTGIEKEDAYYVDAGVTYSGAATGTLTMAHLPNTTVDILADGAAFTGLVTNGAGQATLPAGRTASLMHGGLRASARFIPLPLEIFSDQFMTQGVNKSMKKLFIDFLDTFGGKCGPVNGPYENLTFRKKTDPMGQSPDLKSGLVEIPIQGETERQINFEYVQDLPFPVHIRSLIAEISFGE